MRVAILHFHLRAGGVTRVIEMAWQCLSASGMDVLVITGEAAPEDCRINPADIAVVPELAYGVPASQSEQLLSAVDLVVRRRWGSPAEVMHLHNHSLGKNFALPVAVACWAGEGRKLLLQIHDFAENGRPANYRKLLDELAGEGGLQLYPVAPQVAYALLNSADRERLQASGLNEGCDLLPNPVALPAGRRPVEARELGADRLIVYPTRAIRRKNIGEAVLWATSVEPGEKIVLTAAPSPGRDRERMNEWKVFAEELHLPVVFDAQSLLNCSTVDFLRGAELCLTTSVAEGFGMAFLEPWLAGRGLCGRDLAGVTQDFREAGLNLEALYPRLDVPEALAGDVRGMVEAAVQESAMAYGMQGDAEAAYRSVVVDETADFGRLDEAGQRAVIQAVVAGDFSLNRKLACGFIPENRVLIGQSYSLGAYALRLEAIYTRLAEAIPAAVEFLDAARVLQAHLSSSDFFALRT